MNPYTAFSSVYDNLLKHVDYEYWYKYIKTIMHQYVKNPELILELGCGTGRFGAKFSRDNFLTYGMDMSLDMLQVAKARAFKKYHIFCGDMTGFYLSKKFDFIFSVHDTMNYHLTYNDIKKVLRCVKKIMHPDSVFMFDITTEHNIKTNFDKKSSLYSVRGTDVEWSNTYDRKKKHIYSVLKFRKNGREVASETHIQRIYSADEIKGILQKEGFEIINIFSDYSFTPVQKDTVMINFITKAG
ncbi:MAG: class I SAM-dependent methyltransferase [Spirochaetes bacterium]|nr:class I SAM-dependent methyltransferase [Spirochaetota bacterium]